MSGSVDDLNGCEPNLVPILDMVFQLITFFMLVVNFSANEVDRELILPVIGTAAPVEEPSKSELLVLNIRSSGDVFVRGEKQINVDFFLNVEAQTIARLHNVERGKGLPVRVVVRGDNSLKVERVLEVVDLCRSHGFDKFDFVVMRSATSKAGKL